VSLSFFGSGKELFFFSFIPAAGLNSRRFIFVRDLRAPRRRFPDFFCGRVRLFRGRGELSLGRATACRAAIS